MVDCNGGVDASALFEKGAYCTAGAFRGNEDYIDVAWDIDFCEVFEDWGEAVREVESLCEQLARLLPANGDGGWFLPFLW